MVAPMFARFPHLSDVDPDRRDGKPRRLDWHALLARLDAQRDLRSSFGETLGSRSLAQLMAEGSFDPRAAEMIFSLAASVNVPGDLPERRFSPEDLANLSQAITDGAARLRNPKPSQAKETHEAGPFPVGDDGDDADSATPGPQ